MLATGCGVSKYARPPSGSGGQSGESGSGGSGGSGGIAGTGGAGTGGAAGSGDGGAGTGGAGFGGGGAGGAGSGGRGGGGAGGGQAGGGGAGQAGGGGLGGGTGRGGGGAGGTAAGGAGGAALDTANYNFEVDAQGWAMAATGSAPVTSVGRSTAQRFAGQASLAVAITATTAGHYYVEATPPVPAIPAGATVTFHVFVPAAATGVSAVTSYVIDSNFVFSLTQVFLSALNPNGWTTITLAVPANAATILRVGVRFEISGAFTGTFYVDSVNW